MKKADESCRLHTTPSAVLVVHPVFVAVLVYPHVRDPGPYSTNEKDAYEYHASKCADDLQWLQ